MEKTKPHNSLFQRVSTRLARPVSAVAVDLFRILTGVLVVAYFIVLFGEYSTYTSEAGLLDHVLLREIFWFTKLSLFYPGSPEAYKIGLLALGLMGGLLVLLGIRPKLGAVVAWLVAVSVQRWNFAVINVDDSSITLLLWWMLFLPIGQTFTLKTLRGLSDWREEARLQVNGFFLRAFFANLFIYYLTAGLTKLGSELWREGLALYVILNLPLARTQGFWQAEHMPLLWMGNHFTLLMEPLFPFLVLLRKGHPLKWIGGFCWFIFHLSIPITIGVPFANLALIIALVLVFHEELGERMIRWAGEERELQVSSWKAPRGTKSLICSYLLVLLLAMQKNVPVLDAVWEPAMATLYLGGVAQEYHLFDWIDRFNWTVQHRVRVIPDQGEAFELPSDLLFPRTVRGFIVQSYLLPMRWMRVPRPLTGEMSNAVLARAAQRMAANHSETLGERGRVEVLSKVGRLDLSDLRGEQLWDLVTMKFRYEQGQATIEFPQPPGEVKL